MKKINQLVIRTFIGPFVMTFFISLFILLMQFLWKYIDDLAGKGLEWSVIFRLMVYVAITLVPLALPLAILLSSIMTYGTLAENYEIVACKSAGMSLRKIMKPLIVVTAFICLAAFYFSNNILPFANLKMNALLYDVRNQKPALVIKEGVFYNGIDGYVIRVGKKDSDNRTIHNVLIFDHTDNRGNTKMIMADKGEMVMSHDERYLIVTLYNGRSYEEQRKDNGPDNHPLLRTEFEKEEIHFDLSAFKLTRTDEKLFKDNYQMLNLRQLTSSADSIQSKMAETRKNYQRYNKSYYEQSVPDIAAGGFQPELKTEKSREQTAMQSRLMPLYDSLNHPKDLIQLFDKSYRAIIVSSALSSARNSKDIALDAATDIDIKRRSLAKHEIEWHRKFTLSFACLILFFIGAPLGAIIRKGGLGMPVVISVLFFIIYHVISITGEKFSREGVLPASEGMWISSVVMLPIGIYLTYKATTDSTLFNIDTYMNALKKIFRKDQ